MKITQYMYSRCAQWTYGSSELVPTTAPVNHDRSMIHVRLRLRNCVNAAIINMYKSRIRNENDASAYTTIIAVWAWGLRPSRGSGTAQLQNVVTV